MDIYINGKTADITLETEKTIGDLLSGIEDWLRSAGCRINGLEIDGHALTGADIASAFGRTLEDIGAVNIKVCPHSELVLDALNEARGFLPDKKRRTGKHCPALEGRSVGEFSSRRDRPAFSGYRRGL